MCGFAGYLVENAQPLAERTDTILAMLRPLATRGPDDEGIALLDPERSVAVDLRTPETPAGAVPDAPGAQGYNLPHSLALGHRRFSIIDPSVRGHQPFWSDDRSVCLTFNGEVYNYIELRGELETAGCTFRTSCDTEVLLAAYRYWGEACFERLVGFWALALYDSARGGVLLSRDRMGKAPLYVTRRDGKLWWSSEIKSLRAGAGDFPVREQAVSDFAVAGLRDVHGRTFYEGIDTFPRASWAWVGGDGAMEPRGFWDLPQERLSEREISPGEAAAGVTETLHDALRVRLRADVPIGIELSGGLDSSSLVGLSASAGQRLRAFTVSFPGTDADEEPFARAVWERWRDTVDYEVLTPADADFFDRADGYVGHMDEPFHSPNLLANQGIWHEMAARGIRVSINGAAGDELFCGYQGTYLIPFLAHLLERGRLPRLHAESTSFAERPARPGSALQRARVSAAAKYVLKAHLPTLAREQTSAVGPVLAGLPPALRHDPAPIERLLREKATDWLMSYWLRSGHQNFMGVPVEVRTPFLDHRVVEHAFSLPVTYLIRDGWTKWVLRKAVEDVLPAEVAWRREKKGFPFPLERWQRANRERFFSAIGPAESCPYVDVKRLRDDYDQLVTTDPGGLWRVMSICLWWTRCVLDEPIAA